MSLNVTAIPAFNDNYIWCIHNQAFCVVVDPGDAGPVLEYCQSQKLTLSGVLVTHHHWDHTDGLDSLLRLQPDLPIYGPNSHNIEQVTQTLAEDDSILIEALNLQLKVLEIPGHTLDHIAYYGDIGLFCGDTLFSAGCGRLFEGSPQQMYRSLSKLSHLPAQTKVYCTHEYTLANIAFAQAVEPNNQALANYKQWAENQRQQNQATLPSSLANELAVNPFLRCNQTEVIQGVELNTNQELNSEQEVFTALRKWKDNF
ncbi:hydroxyacylglutathione hydrolase [Paraglaciecola aquimarina]|uniref:Hydroxyacylglutathione hydrolase n=1 Tax=Paraglaciecola algarum TaxID=3050085 RepID=A0ABS9D4S5_9ALTE|nr:hydroxyacylglutathione hydrolase [Paraglaciecola sp. G1-23]MCF2946824.1 hydroxyacylglutathione hydrolase [Paraglaciecola sp. G1-23]